MNRKQMIKEQKRIKKERRETQYLFNNESDIYKNLIRITLGVILFVLFVFCLINITKGNWNLFNKKNIETEQIDNRMVMVGTMFNKSDEEYLVLAYDMSNINDHNYYGYVSSNYYGSKVLYYLDLSSGFNSKFVGNNENITSDLNKLQFKGPTLLLIKGNQILKSYTNEDAITNYFKNEK